MLTTQQHRTRLRGRLVLPVAFGIGVAVAAGAALSPGAPEAAEAASSWRVECTSADKTLDCRMVQEALRQDNHQIIAAVVVRVPAETKKPVMMIQLPLGILVSTPVKLSVENQPPVDLAIQTCTAAGCFVGAPIDDKLLAALRSGKKLDISFQGTDRQPVSVAMPLTGFAVAYDKIK